MGEGVEGAHDEQSLVSADVGVDFLHVNEGCHERGFAHRPEAHGAARTHNLSHRRVRRTLGCPLEEDRSSGFGVETEVTRGVASAATDVEVSVVNRAWTRSRHGAERRDMKGVVGGSLCHDLAGRSVEGRVSAVGLGLGGRIEAFGQRGSR